MSRGSYKTSHPWLTFSLDTSRFSPKIWILLGEAASKFEHLAGTPLRPDVAQEMNRVYLAKGVRATTAIEGNTLSEQEVAQIIDKKLQLPPSKQYLQQEVDNIIKGCGEIIETAFGASPSKVTVDGIRAFNRRVLDGLEVESHVIPGEVRKCNVGVSNYKAPDSEDCTELLERLVQWLNDGSFSQTSEHGLVPVVLQAIVAHLYIAWIHPFGDGNGRTARLLEYAILVGAGVPLPAAHLLSNHYNETRTDYYRQLDRASRDSTNGVDSFIGYAVQGLVDGLRQQIERVKALQLDVSWENYVHEVFHDATAAQKRQRNVVLALSSRTEPVPPAKLPYLTEEVTKAYASESPDGILRKLRRDIRALSKGRLIVRVGHGVMANKNVMKAFLPPRATNHIEKSARGAQ